MAGRSWAPASCSRGAPDDRLATGIFAAGAPDNRIVVVAGAPDDGILVTRAPDDRVVGGRHVPRPVAVLSVADVAPDDVLSAGRHAPGDPVFAGSLIAVPRAD